MKRTQKGFTLIELLVVIAVIGLLSTLTMVSLGGVRARANDAAISSSMHQLQVVAEIYNSENGSYGATSADSIKTTCEAAGNPGAGTTKGDLWTLCQDIKKKSVAQGGVPTVLTNAGAATSATAYCAFTKLASYASSNRYHCIDSASKSVLTTTVPSGAGFCVGTAADPALVCPPAN